MRNNLKQVIIKATYQMESRINLNKKFHAVNKACKEVKDLLNQKEK